jgi:hypothetical protein
MLNSKDTITIMLEVVNGWAPTVTGPEADAYRKEYAAKVEEAAKKGLVIDIPFEFPTLAHGGEGR